MLESIRHCHLQHCISKRISRLSSAIEEKGVQVSFCLQQSTFWFFSPTAGEATSYNNVRISIEPVNAWKTRILALQCFADFLNICTRAFGTRGWHRTSCARSLKCRVRWRAPKRTMSPQNRKDLVRIWDGNRSACAKHLKSKHLANKSNLPLGRGRKSNFQTFSYMSHCWLMLAENLKTIL